MLMVANLGEDSISIIDENDLREFKRIKLSPLNNTKVGPHNLVLDEEKNFVYIINSFDNSLAVIELTNYEVVYRQYVGERPICLHIDYPRNLIYISNTDGNTVSIIDRENYTVLGQIEVGNMPCGLKLHPKTRQLYVVNMESNDIYVLDTEDFKIDFKIPVEINPTDIEFDDEGNYAYVTNSYLTNGRKGTLSVIDVLNKRVIKSIGLGMLPFQICKGFDNRLYIINLHPGELSILEMGVDMKYKNFYIGGMLHSITLSDSSRAFVTNVEENCVMVFDIINERISGKLRVGKEPHGILYYKNKEK